MPTTIPDAIARFLPNGPRKKAKSPGIYVPPNYMAPDMGATVDDSPPASAKDKDFIMQVVGVFLFYARMVDCTMLPITTFISKQQSKPTQKTLEATLQLLDYAAAHPNHKVTFRACNMQLRGPIRRFALIPGQRRLHSRWHSLLLQLQRQPH